MRIHQVELEHVRLIKRVVLDFSHPLTIVGGRNGIGKTAVQEAILTAMFERKKEDREGLVSRFDPDSPPVATLHLSRGEAQPTIRLRRTLSDKSGEWIEGPIRIKAKGEALKKVQDSLPLSAEAAALLLWGRQGDLAAVVRDFPRDGHSLLTNATIKGAGPDPKEVIADLDNQVKTAKRGGQHPGPLSRAQDRVAALQAELREAQESLARLEKLQQEYGEARAHRDRLSRDRQQAEQEVERLDRLQGLFERALAAQEEADRLQKQSSEWDGLDDEIRRHGRALDEFREDVQQLESQHRVALDVSLADQTERLVARLRLAEEADAKCRKFKEELQSRPRPDLREVKLLDQFQDQRNEALNRLDATGLRYELSVAAGTKRIEVAEDNGPGGEITLAPGQVREGIVGSVTIRVDQVRLVARGKEDVSSLKRASDRAEREIAALVARFHAADEEDFRRLADERCRIAETCANAEVDLKKHLRDDTLDSLRVELESLRNRRAQNGVTPQDQEAWRKAVLPPVPQIEKLIFGKRGELDNQAKMLKQLEGRRPTDAQQAELRAALRQSRAAAEGARDAFLGQSPESQPPSKGLRDAIRTGLAKARARLDDLKEKQRLGDVHVERLSGELTHAGPKRPINRVEADLDDARAGLRREQILQEARELLKERIAETIREMSEGVPKELAARIGRHLARLTGGAYGNVSLNEAFSVDKVCEGGDRPELWQPHELSAGEQALTALVMKIAVARALAESGTPVFVLLDDSLVSLDPQHRAATEALLVDLIADGKLQVILLTCHTDWALDWQRRSADRVHYIDLASQAEYYRPPRC